MDPGCTCTQAGPLSPGAAGFGSRALTQPLEARPRHYEHARTDRGPSPCTRSQAQRRREPWALCSLSQRLPKLFPRFSSPLHRVGLQPQPRKLLQSLSSEGQRAKALPQAPQCGKCTRPTGAPWWRLFRNSLPDLTGWDDSEPDSGPRSPVSHSSPGQGLVPPGLSKGTAKAGGTL